MRTCILLRLRSWVSKLKPVTLPPGRARLGTRPAPTASAIRVITMGTVAVACLAAWADGVLTARMTSTWSRTSSAASALSRSFFPSAFRNAMVRLCPSTYPSARSPSQKASRSPGGAPAYKSTPMRCPFPACCACATTAAKSKARRRMNVFRIIAASGRRSCRISVCVSSSAIASPSPQPNARFLLPLETGARDEQTL